MRTLDVRRILGFVLGLISCSFLGIIEPWYLAYAAVFGMALFVAGHIHGRTKRLVEAVPLAWFIVLVLLQMPLFALLAQTMLVAMASRLALTENVRDYQGLVLMSIFIAVLSAAGSIAVSFGVILLAEFVAAALLLILAQFEGKVPRVGVSFFRSIALYTAISFVFAFAVFYALPRWTMGYIRGNPVLAAQTTGFSKDVTITPGKVTQDDTVVMRIEPIPRGNRLPLPAYVSGMRYSVFTGKQWLVTPSRPESLYPSGDSSFSVRTGTPNTVTTVFLEPSGTDVIFCLDFATSVRGQFQVLHRDAEGNVSTEAPYYKTIRYDADSLDAQEFPAGIADGERTGVQNRYLQLPELSAAFRAVAARAGSGGTVRSTASAVRDFLTTNYAYSLDPTATSIEDFVVNRGTGYCEHFATAMVLLLRAEDVPARLVSGFVATEWNQASGYLIVRAKDAHTWVEVLDGDTWVRYDPTPASFQRVSLINNLLDNIRMIWYRSVVTYDLARQMAAVDGVGRTVGKISMLVTRTFEAFQAALAHLRSYLGFLTWIALGTLLAAVILLCRRRERAPARFARTLQAVLGGTRRPGETLLEYAVRMRASQEVLGLVWRDYRLRFAGAEATRHDEQALIADLRAARPRTSPQL